MSGLRESRLKFTDKERLDPVMGKAVRKAEKAADKAEKAQAKIPTKKVIKRELINDNSNGKIKVKLHFEDMEKKPPSQLKVTDAPAAAVRRQIRQEIRESEDDNVGVEAADTVADSAEGTGHLLQEAHHHAQLQPYRAAARAEKQLEKANLHALQKKAEVEHPTSNPLSRWRQKQVIKRQYAAQKAGRSTVEGSARAAKEAAKKSEQAATFVARHRKGFAAVLGILLILAFLLNAVSSCSMMVEGIGAGIAAGSYAAADDDIVGAEAAYCAMEQALQRQLDRYEQTHDYDEYHYELDDIGHDPYVLTAILSAMHPGEWKLQEVMGTLEMLFEKQYILTETVESETRYRTETVTGERHARDPVTGAYLYDQWGDPIMEEYEYETQVPYTYRSVTVKLENFDLSHVPVYVMDEETLGRYALYMATLGNRPDLFPDSDYIRQMLIEGYTKYDFPPEALENTRFAAMIKEAEKYLGYPYVWGGSSPSTSFDCSGYVCWVLNHSGWSVGRTSAQGLYNLCTPVSRSNARPGDLVFFKGTYKTNGVSHVGIYVGENRMIHCGNPISYTNINTQYWQSHFFTFGRLP
ncbi:MAG: CD1108 family mobile element protein [Faecousia sp.]